MALNERSLKNLEGVHHDLVEVVKLAASRTKLPFIVTEGVRTLERQKELKEAGASKTLKSRHLKTGDGFAHAVDLAAVVGGEIRWDWPLYATLAFEMKKAADELAVPIIWGGDWNSFKDGPHFELPREEYP